MFLKFDEVTSPHLLLHDVTLLSILTENVVFETRKQVFWGSITS